MKLFTIKYRCDVLSMICDVEVMVRGTMFPGYVNKTKTRATHDSRRHPSNFLTAFEQRYSLCSTMNDLSASTAVHCKVSPICLPVGISCGGFDLDHNVCLLRRFQREGCQYKAERACSHGLLIIVSTFSSFL
jgi:hypothetical protein